MDATQQRPQTAYREGDQSNRSVFAQMRSKADEWILANPGSNRYRDFIAAFGSYEVHGLSKDYIANRRRVLRAAGLVAKYRPSGDETFATVASEPGGLDPAQARAEAKGHIPGQEEYLRHESTHPVSHEADQLEVKAPPSDEEYEDFFQLLETADALKGTLYSQQMETTFRPAEQSLPLGVCFTGDWHLGGGGVQYQRLREDLELIRDTPGLYVVGSGDYKDNFKPQMKAGNGMFGEILTSPAWQNKMVLMRARIAVGKWLAIGDGNHDAWDTVTAGLASTPDLAAALGVPFFGEGGGTIYVELEGIRYALGVKHNNQGNSRLNTTNAQRRAFDEWPQWENMDVICLAHYHFNDLQKVSRKGQSVVYLRNGTYKSGRTDEGVPRDEYSAKLGLTPEYGVPLVVLYPGTRKVIAFRGDDFLEGVAFLELARATARRAL